MLFFLNWVAQFLSAVGAINFGLVTFFNFDLIGQVAQIVQIRGFEKILYGIVGISGVFSLVSLFVVV